MLGACRLKGKFGLKWGREVDFARKCLGFHLGGVKIEKILSSCKKKIHLVLTVQMTNT
jgi:hypothetical protein